MERIPDNSLMVLCGGEVVVTAAHNAAAAADDVAATVGVAAVDDVVIVVGARAVVWVQRCWMRPCTSPQSHFVSVVVTLRGNELSWSYRQTT